MIIEEIKKAVDLLPEKEHLSLRNWFWEKWGREIEKDSDFLIEEALNEKNRGTLKLKLAL